MALSNDHFPSFLSSTRLWTKTLFMATSHIFAPHLLSYVPVVLIQIWNVDGIPTLSVSRHGIMTAAMFGQMISCQDSLLPVTESWEEVMQPHYSVPRLPCKLSCTDLCHGGRRPNNTEPTSFPSTTALVWQQSLVVPRQKRGSLGTS